MRSEIDEARKVNIVYCAGTAFLRHSRRGRKVQQCLEEDLGDCRVWRERDCEEVCAVSFRTVEMLPVVGVMLRILGVPAVATVGKDGAVVFSHSSKLRV